MNKSVKVICGVFVFVVLVLVVLAAGSGEVEGETLTVDDDGVGEYTRIKDALNAADEGDTIRVWEGTYNEAVIVDKSINLIGNGSEYTTIQGYSDGILTTKADGVNLSGFEIHPLGYNRKAVLIESDHNTISENDCWNDGQKSVMYVTGESNTIRNNIFHGGDNALYLYDAHGNTISENSCDSTKGIRLSSSSNNRITNNDFSRGGWNCITIDGDNNTISGNSFSSEGGGGIDVTGGQHNTISDNSWAKNSTGGGIELSGSRYNTLFNNLMSGGGLGISGDSLANWNTHTIDPSNTVGGKVIYYYADSSGMTVASGAGQVILANCTQMEVSKQNCSNVGIGISLGFSSHNTIKDNICLNDSYGISLLHSSDNTLENNSCSSGTTGMRIGGDHNILLNNTCVLTNYGIFVEGDHNTLLNNTLKGVSLTNTQNNTLSGNKIIDGIINIWGTRALMSSHTILPDNTVDAKPMYYFADQTSGTISSEAGQVFIVKSRNIIVKDIEGQGIGYLSQ